MTCVPACTDLSDVIDIMDRHHHLHLCIASISSNTHQSQVTVIIFASRLPAITFHFSMRQQRTLSTSLEIATHSEQTLKVSILCSILRVR